MLGPLLTYFTRCFSISIVNFEHVITSWIGFACSSLTVTTQKANACM